MKNRGLDSKYSWMVAIAGSIVFLLTALPMRLGSQLFVFMIEYYNITRKAASFTFSLSYFMRSISGPIVGFFGEKFGLQQVTLFGCLLCALGVGGCFFAESIITVYVFLGIIFGFGFGLSTLIVPEIINLHFDEHRAKAIGVVFAGMGLGTFIMPPIIEIILKDYGISETFLIMCAILLNAIPAAMLMPVPKSNKQIVERKHIDTASYIKNVREPQEISPYFLSSDHISSSKESESNKHILLAESTKNGLHSYDSSQLIPSKVIKTMNSASQSREILPCFQLPEQVNCLEDTQKTNNVSVTQFSKCGIPTSQYNPVVNTDSLLNTKNEADSKIAKKIKINSRNLVKTANESKMSTCDVTVIKSNFSLYSPKDYRSTPVLIDVRNLRKQSLPYEKESFQKLNEIEVLQKLPSKSSYASCSILWDPIFLILTVVNSLSSYVMYMFWTITVDIVRDKGVDRNLEVYFVMAQSLFEMIGLATFGIIPDAGYMTDGNFCAFCFAILGLSCILLIYVSGFWPTMIGISVLSAVLGGNVTGLPGTITQFIDGDKRSMAMASRLTMYAPLSFTMSPLIGYFRETLGSYDGLMYTMAGMCTLCTILLLILPRLIKLKKKEKIINLNNIKLEVKLVAFVVV